MQLRWGPKHEPRPHQSPVFMDNNMKVVPRQVPNPKATWNPSAWMCKPSLIPGPDLYSRKFLAALLNDTGSFPSLFSQACKHPAGILAKNWGYYLCSLPILLSTMHLFFSLAETVCPEHLIFHSMHP